MRLALTKRGEYGVRILVHLAMKAEGARMTAQELAEACAIPLGNVPTIVNILSRSGLLLSTPGRNGGCSLSRPPEDIAMLEIVECLEGAFDVSRCLLDSRRCHDKDPECALHFAWKAGRDAAIGSLAGTTLAATAAREVELQAMGASRPGRAASVGMPRATRPRPTAKRAPSPKRAATPATSRPTPTKPARRPR